MTKFLPRRILERISVIFSTGMVFIFKLSVLLIFRINRAINEMHLKNFKYLSFLLFYLFSLGFLYAGDNPIAGADANPQLPRRGILVLHELREGLDEVIKENERLKEHECPTPRPDPKVEELTRDLNNTVEQVEQLRMEKGDLISFCRFLVDSRNLRMIDYFQAFFNPDVKQDTFEKLLTLAQEDELFSTLSFTSYGTSGSLNRLVRLVRGVESGVYESPAKYHVTADVTVKGTVVGATEKDLFERIREHMTLRNQVTPKR